ncbi:MAG: hypothetical protein HQL58_08520 [Magnetococcales bacterium]|nr:hypothetical protein [Magnetococcales bacterium]
MADKAEFLRCPVCKGKPARIYKCLSCGEVRCGQPTCDGSMGSVKGWAGAGTLCRHCGTGRYTVMDVFSAEFHELERATGGRSSPDSES